jgi:ureidoglycolate lyase
VIFIKSSSTVVGPGDPVLVPPEADLTYEAELAAVIGRQALNVSRSQAMAHIAGYTLFNDVSATRYVRDDGGFVRGKNQPASGPLGPWIVLPEDIADPHDLPIRLEVDGNTLQDSNTSQMLHGIEALVAYISTQMPLDVGDIIATGTPAGVAAHHQPAAWLSRGQEVLIRSTPWFGELKNPVL